MADEKEKTPYDELLEEIANLKKENESIRKDLNEVRDFNRALLARKDISKPSQDNSEVMEKFDKFIKGE